MRTPRSKRRWLALGTAVAAMAMVLQPAGSLGLTPGMSVPKAAIAFDTSKITVDPSATGAFRCQATDPVPARLEQAGLVTFAEDPTAGTWQTWFVDPAQVTVPPPPDTASLQTAEELLELQQIALNRTANQTLKAKFWDQGGASQAWTSLYLELIVRHSSKDGSKNPPRLSRQIAILQTAIFDSLAVTYAAKYCYKRPAPSTLDPVLLPIVDVRSLPSYPSEHAAVAGAAITIMKRYFPCPDPIGDPTHCEEPTDGLNATEREATESRLWGGVNYRSDIEAGLAIGRAVAQQVLDAREDDGYKGTWDGSGRIFGPCNWAPTPPAFRPVPVEPVWGQVTPWVMTSGSQFRPAPPIACDGTDYIAQSRDLFEISKTLTARQKEIANYWAGGQGTETPPGQNLHIALNATIERDLSTMKQARVLAHVGAGVADAAIASWDAKFAYWGDRPANTIRRLWDPTWVSFITTPPFPGYTSGHSTFSSTTATVLSHFFPDDAVEFRSLATEAALSRFYGGIHIRMDNDTGLSVGENIGGAVVARALGDGAE